MNAFRLITIFLFLYVISFSHTHSQNAWIRQDSTGKSISGLDFINQNTGIYCGNLSSLYKTNNGGLNWNKMQTLDTDKNYLNVNMVNNDIIFFHSSYGGNVYKSTNAGANWIIIHATDFGIESLNMYDINLGYMAAMSLNYPDNTRYILKTINGGLNWNTVFSSPNLDFYDVYCLNRDTVFISGSNNVWISTNSGNNWITSPVNSQNPTYLKSVIFLNFLTGFTAGVQYRTFPSLNNYPIIYRTTNNGISWNEKVFLNNPNRGFTKISFLDINNGFAVGDSGIIYRTTNMGNTWIRQRKLYQNIYEVSYRGIDKATVAGGKGVVYSTENGGWDTPLTPNLISPPNNSNYISLTPLMNWQLVEYNAAVYRLQISSDSNFNSTILDITNLDTSGFSVPSNILTPNNIYCWRMRSENPIYSSPWSTVWKFNTNTPPAPNLISPVNNDTNVVPTQLMDWSDVVSAISYKTQIANDSNFNQIIADTTSINSQFNIQYGILLINSNYYWRARANNINGAGVWSSIWKFRTTNIRPNLLIPENTDTGIVYNALFDWDNFPNAVTYRIQFALDSVFANIVFDYSYLYSSQYRLNRGMSQNTNYYWRVNATTSNTISFWSEIRKFKTSSLYTGIKDNEEIPTEFNIYNNYPNPFNPVTKISFDLPKDAEVKLIVYDIFGREITRLLNSEFKQAGKYIINFDAMKYNLASGVYFYRIETDKYTAVKKMILLK